jgi:hypothetical protein
MSVAITERRSTMLKNIVLATLALGFSGAVLADPPRWAPAHGYRAKHQHHHHYRSHYYHAPHRVVVVPAPRVVYAPPPPVVYPYYAAPVVVHPAPVYAAPSLSIRFNIPL